METKDEPSNSPEIIRGKMITPTTHDPVLWSPTKTRKNADASKLHSCASINRIFLGNSDNLQDFFEKCRDPVDGLIPQAIALIEVSDRLHV